MSAQQQAQEFLAKFKDAKFRVFANAFDELPEDVQTLVTEAKQVRHRQEVIKLFEEEGTPTGDPWEEQSESGRYKLVVQRYAFKKGWNYSKGSVYRGDELLFEVHRNYGGFPFLFIEGHPNGHDYLVCGEDYQGQTVLELDTGRRRDFIPNSGTLGVGFCWVSMRFDAATKLLVVAGCIWACPYEYRFYDFSDPMEGWPSLESDEGYFEDDNKWPEIEPDGTIRVFQTVEEDDEDDDNDNRIIASILTLRREGLTLKLQDQWVSDAEKERREKSAEAQRKYEAWLQEFRTTDPLYLKAKELMAEPPFTPEDHEGIGITYKGWCPDFDKEERRICRRIVKRADPDAPGWTIDLEWGHETGPVKLNIFKDGNSKETKWFEHSVAGMQQAFTYAKELMV